MGRNRGCAIRTMKHLAWTVNQRGRGARDAPLARSAQPRRTEYSQDLSAVMTVAFATAEIGRVPQIGWRAKSRKTRKDCLHRQASGQTRRP